MTEETYCAGGLRRCAVLALSPTEKVGIGHCALCALHPIPLATVSGGNNE